MKTMCTIAVGSMTPLGERDRSEQPEWQWLRDGHGSADARIATGSITDIGVDEPCSGHHPCYRTCTKHGSVRTVWGYIHRTDSHALVYAADAEQIDLNAPHAPTDKAFEAFEVVEHTIKSEILKSRHHWNKHEPRMWSRAEGVSDEDLVAFSIRNDLVEIRSAPTSYGTIILGKIRLPAINDAEGEGYIHVRCVGALACGRSRPDRY